MLNNADIQADRGQLLTLRAFAETWANEQIAPKEWTVAAELLVSAIERSELGVLGDPYAKGEPEHCIYDSETGNLIPAGEAIWRHLGHEVAFPITDQVRHAIASHVMLPLSAFRTWFEASRRNERPSGVEHARRRGLKPPRVLSMASDVSTATQTDQVSPKPATRGRPRNSGSYDHIDLPLIDKARQAFSKGEFASLQKALESVAQQAPGASLEAKIERLRKKARHR